MDTLRFAYSCPESSDDSSLLEFSYSTSYTLSANAVAEEKQSPIKIIMKDC